MDNRSIGVFDSGLGGLTVLREIIKQVPSENLIYFGDTARFPYGTKKLSDVKKYVFKITEFLQKQNIKLAVIACNTASAAALNDLGKYFDLPIIGVIKPGARTASKNTISKKIGVIATNSTVKSRAYDIELKKIDPQARLFSVAIPKLVEYVEKGILEGDELNSSIISYISPLIKKDIDILILGCTHLPLIEKQILNCCGGRFKVVSSAVETAKDVKDTLDKLKINCNPGQIPSMTFYETGEGSKMLEVGTLFLGRQISDVVRVKLGTC